MRWHSLLIFEKFGFTPSGEPLFFYLNWNRDIMLNVTLHLGNYHLHLGVWKCDKWKLIWRKTCWYVSFNCSPFLWPSRQLVWWLGLVMSWRNTQPTTLAVQLWLTRKLQKKTTWGYVAASHLKVPTVSAWRTVAFWHWLWSAKVVKWISHDLILDSHYSVSED